MEIPHSDLSKVTRMVLVEIRPVVMQATGHTTSTGMLAVLSYSSVAGGDMTTAVRALVWVLPEGIRCWSGRPGEAYCLRVFESRVGIVLV